MPVRLINAAEVRRLVPMDDCIEIMRGALRTLSSGDAVQPLRSATWLPDRSGLIGVMPGYLGAPRSLGVKVVTVYPKNHERGLDSHQGAVLHFDPDDGRLLAVIDGSAVTAIRTAAVSAVATDLLARADSTRLAIIGSGVQATEHLDALRHVRSIDTVRIWSRDPEHAVVFAEREARRHGLSVAPRATVEEAVAEADIICTVTGATDPVLLGAWIPDGAHVNAVGACTPNARELDTAAVSRSRLFVDWRDSAINEAGDFRFPREEGAVTERHIRGDIGELLSDRCRGRSTVEEITLFKSLGVAIEDLAMSHALFTRAESRNVGQVVDLDGS